MAYPMRLNPHKKRFACSAYKKFVLLCALTILVSVKATTPRSNRNHERDVKKEYSKVSAVYTPYHLTPGGGERVVLNFVALLQDVTGSDVELIVSAHNVCTRLQCVQTLASTLKVDSIRWNRLQVKM